MSNPSPHTAEGRYESLTGKRSTYLERGREVAKVTIPSIIRDHDGPATGNEIYDTPFQGVGARGVSNLAAKLIVALFPPGSSFFQKTPAPGVEDELRENGQLTEVLDDLVLYEDVVMDMFDGSNARPVLAQVFRHLITIGNSLLEVTAGGRFKMHPLTDYVVARDGEGEVYEVVVRESFVKDTLDEEVQALLGTDAKSKESDEVFVYTWYELVGNQWWILQEVEGQIIPGTVRREPRDSPSVMPLRWNTVDGEDYGRGLGEEYLGDLTSLESLTQSIVEFAAAAAKILLMVDPTGMTQKRDIEYSRSGDVVDGDARDVTVLSLDKFNDFRVAQEVARSIEDRLSAAFLLNSSIQRNAERVTAEEIRFMAGELEAALGGVYSSLSQELQLPLVRLMERHLQKKNKLPDLKNVKAVIITGLEGLGRQGDLLKLDILIQGLGTAFGPAAVAQNINPAAYLRRRAAALGIDAGDIVYSEEEKQQMAQAQAQREQAVKAAPQGVKAISDIALKTAEAQGGP